MADVEASKSLSGLLNGIAQKVYYNNSEITEELLKDELYPELSQEEFKALHEKMKALIKVMQTKLHPECSLLQKYQPQYNVLFFCVDINERYLYNNYKYVLNSLYI